MRVVAADPVHEKTWRLGVRPRVRATSEGSSQAVRFERVGLTVVAPVLLLGLWLAYSAQTSEFAAIPQALTDGRIVNLSTLQNSRELLAPLTIVDDLAERRSIADAIYRRASSTELPRLEHVGGLIGLLTGAPQAGNAAAGRMLGIPDISALKPSLIVRTPDEYTRRLAIALALFLIPFWIVHLVRWHMGSIGDPILLPTVHLLTGLGIMAMIALRDPLRDMMIVVPTAGGIAAGCAIWLAASSVDFEDPRLRRAVLTPLTGAVVLATALLLFGSGPTGSGAKVNLLGVQPVEAIRLLIVFSLAAYFARRWQFLREFSEPTAQARGLWKRVRLPRWKDVRPLAISIGTFLGFFFLQKDLGPALVLSCVFLGLYGISRGRAALVAGGFVALLIGFATGYALGFPATVTRRVAIWMDPWENALPRGDQISHALWALASGGPLGVGPGVGDPQLIPAGHTDLIVAAIGEELGFVGVFAVTALFAILVWRMLRITLRAPGDYTLFLSAGLTLALVLQAIVIVGGILGLLPLAGVVTPFLSYGRSAMLSNFAAIAICAAIARRAGPARDTFVAPVRALGYALATAAGIILVTAGTTQVVRADSVATRGNLTEQADGGFRYLYNPRLTSAARQISRGTIYDRNGVPIATNRPEELKAFADRYKRMGIALPHECHDGSARCYPLGGLAFHLLGDAGRQTNWAARNASFAEKDFDARLRGFDDAAQVVEVRHPRTGRMVAVVKREYAEVLPLIRHKGNPGHPEVTRLLGQERDLHTTIDAGLQVATARAVQKRAASTGSGRGAAVVVDPATGDLLASVSYPWPEAADFTADTIDPQRLLDRARYGLYPPGSTFKLVTAVAALRADPAQQHATFMCVRLPDNRVGGRVPGVGRPVRDDPLDHAPHGRVDLHRGLVVSCNAYFANLAQRIGAEAVGETASQAQIAAAPSPLVENLRNTLPHAGYGQGDVVASPLRMARVTAAIASDGVLKDVRLIGGPVKPGTPWLPAGGAAQLRGYMREAVTGGTGRALAGHRVPIAGKTGTAEVDNAPSHSWFTGFAPSSRSEKRIAFAVIVENAGYGGRVAAPIAGDIVSAAQSLGLIQ